MKKFIIIVCVFFSTISMAQTARNGISYQAVILNPNPIQLPGADYNNAPLANKSICLRFDIIDHNNQLEYSEHYPTTTDSYGMVNVVIGTGNQISYNGFQDVKWSLDTKSLKVYIDTDGFCSNFEVLSNQDFSAVPFALWSPASDIPGPKGSSAYDIWKEKGNTGDEEGFLKSLIGEKGSSAYEVWLENGNEGTEQDFLTTLKGVEGSAGASAYETWLLLGNEGTEQNFINFLRGSNGSSGASAYDSWLSLGNEGTEEEFINSLKGRDGTDGIEGSGSDIDYPDGEQDGDILQWIWNTDHWEMTIVKPGSQDVSLTSVLGTNNQSICELTELKNITYAFSGTLSDVSVAGLPNGIGYTLEDNVMTIKGTPTIDVDQQTNYKYIILATTATQTINATGNITINPSASLEVTSGSLTQSSCLGVPITPIVLDIINQVPNAKVVGLPEGITASINGSSLTISGTPSSATLDGSSFEFVISSQSTSCSPATLVGTLNFTDCSSCIPTVSAGSDNTICSGQPYNLSGSATNFTTVKWTSSGTGTFNDDSLPNTQYVPTLADANSGEVTLTYTAVNTSCTQSQTVSDAMVLKISNCSSITLELENNPEAYLFAYDLKFGAKVIADNIQEVANVGLCYNTVGGPTINDTKVSQNNTNSGWWTSNPPRFEMEMSGMPIDSLFIRAYATTIGGDVFYGDQIGIANTDPNRNQIYNFEEVSEDFSPDNYTINTTSDITFVNITELKNLNWNYGTSVPNYSNIVEVNFPNLETVRESLWIINEKSLREFNAPKLKQVRESINFHLTSLETIYLPVLNDVGVYRRRSGDYIVIASESNSIISNNYSLKNVNLNLFNEFYHPFAFRYNPQLESLEFNNLENGTYLDIRGNDKLEQIVLTNQESLSVEARIISNPNLGTISATQLSQAGGLRLYVASNNSLVNVDFPLLSNINYLELRDNDLQTRISLPALDTVQSNLYIADNALLEEISAPNLSITGTRQYKDKSFEIKSNSVLNSIDFSSLNKVYGQMIVSSNSQLSAGDFPCNFFIYENDGFDCNFGIVSISGNGSDTYCFQDANLLAPITITTVPLTNVTGTQAQSGGIISAPSQMFQRGCVWSTTQTPTLEDDFYSENGNLNGSYDSYMYNLSPNTTYYVRAYGVDCNATYYGNTLTFTTSN